MSAIRPKRNLGIATCYFRSAAHSRQINFAGNGKYVTSALLVTLAYFRSFDAVSVAKDWQSASTGRIGTFGLTAA